jgi:hypothetical protein
MACVLAAVLCACASDAAPAARGGGTDPAGAGATLPAPVASERAWTCAGACVRWRPVLDRLDSHRARAYATARPRALRRVYVPGSRVLVRDRRMLRAWARRDATVAGVRLRVLHVRRLPSTGADVRLRVADRLGRATAALSDGRGVALPRDRPTAHVVVLRRTGAGWRIAATR